MRAQYLFPLLALHGACNMIDVIEEYRLPNTAVCKNGCDDWSNHDPSIWKNGKVPSNAQNHCAQPGAIVNDYIYGSWCYCKPDEEVKEVREEYKVPPPASWDNLGAFRCETTSKQFGTTPPPGFHYDTQPGLTGSLTYNLQTTLQECELLCQHNLTNCDFVSWGHGGFCYLAEWCQNKVPHSDYTTYHNGAQPVPPAPTPPPKVWDYCVSKEGVPEQINMQLAENGTVVVSWITFESAAPKAPPTTVANNRTFTGVTHVHKSPSGRNYYMHFVVVHSLVPGTTYTYVVKGGGAQAAWSSPNKFVAPNSWKEGAPTKFAIYGDLGIYKWNAMEWLEAGCLSGDMELFVHMGDHAYDEGEGDERRADGYMNGFQPALTKCAWMPSVGNHEIFEEPQLNRYRDSTWEKWGPLPITDENISEKDLSKYDGKSSATSSLGYLLSTGNHHGAGTHGATPSGTSRYFSVDFGLVHLVALDLNVYYGCDPCGEQCLQEQLVWLKKDLAAAEANREKVPWILVFSHFPVYCTGCNKPIPDYYVSDDAERHGNANKTEAHAWGKSPAHMKMLRDLGFKQPNLTAKHDLGGTDAMIDDFVPIFNQFGVDLYMGGHWHYYESLWPAQQGPDSCKACAQPTQKDFSTPNVTVHITTGNGGPPGIDTFNEDCPGPDCESIPATRKQTTEFGFGHITAHNHTHLTFRQFLNSNGSLFDEYTIFQPKHGPFTN